MQHSRVLLGWLKCKVNEFQFPFELISDYFFSSPRVQTLMRGLSPAYLRFGGSPADWVVFSNEPEEVFEKSAGVAKMLHTYNSEYKWKYILVSRIERIPLAHLYGILL